MGISVGMTPRTVPADAEAGCTFVWSPRSATGNSLCGGMWKDTIHSHYEAATQHAT